MTLHREIPTLQELKRDIEILIEIYSRGESKNQNLIYFTNETLSSILSTVMKLINEIEKE